MNSPKQARPKSSPKTVIFVKGVKPFAPMVSSTRTTPTGKTVPKLCNCDPLKFG